MNRTEINELGEFGIIDKIKSNFKKKKSSTVISIGDDAAAIRSGKDLVLLSSDMLIEKIHFDLSYTPLKHLGYKSVVVNLSDIYSMNALPSQIILNIAISNKFSVEAIDEFYDGVKFACEEHNIDLIGGENIFSSFEGWKSVNAEAIIELNPDYIILPQRNVHKGLDVTKIADSELFKNTTAGKNENFIFDDAMAMTGLGPRTINSVLNATEFILK